MASITSTHCTVAQAADEIGVTPGRVRQMLIDGEIRGEQVPDQTNGRWLIGRREVDRVARIEHTVGRPRSGKTAS